jgi:hypothetical protein
VEVDEVQEGSQVVFDNRLPQVVDRYEDVERGASEEDVGSPVKWSERKNQGTGS